MAARVKQSLRERAALLAATLIFALGQLIAAGHAEVDHVHHGDHDDHSHHDDRHEHGDRDPIESGSLCTLCCLAASDDDAFTSTCVYELNVDIAFGLGILIPALQRVAVKFETPVFVRGPPHK